LATYEPAKASPGPGEPLAAGEAAGAFVALAATAIEGDGEAEVVEVEDGFEQAAAITTQSAIHRGFTWV